MTQLIVIRGGLACNPIDPQTVFCVSGRYSLSVFGPQTVDLLSQSTMGNNDYQAHPFRLPVVCQTKEV